MTVQTYLVQLEAVQTAITAILTGAQSYSQHGRSRTNADLKTLQEREVYLRRMVQRENASGIVVYGATPIDER